MFNRLGPRLGRLRPGVFRTFLSHESTGYLSVKAIKISEITGYFYGIIHSINGVFLVLLTGRTRAITVSNPINKSNV